jgi:hypothetical protein
VRQIRTLRARWRELETGLRRLLGGHQGGNPGYRQGGSSGLPRQFSTLPAAGSGVFEAGRVLQNQARIRQNPATGL